MNTLTLKDSGGRIVIQRYCKEIRRIELSQEQWVNPKSRTIKISIDVGPAGFYSLFCISETEARAFFDDLQDAVEDGGVVRMPKLEVWLNTAEEKKLT